MVLYTQFCLHPVPAKDATFNCSWKNWMVHLNFTGLLWVVACMFFTVKLKKQYHIITTQPGIAKDPWNTKWKVLNFFPLPYLFPYLTNCLFLHFCSLLLNLFAALDFSQNCYLHVFLYELTKAFGTLKVTSRSNAEIWYLAFYKSHLPPNNSAFTAAVLEGLELKNVGSEAKEKYLCTV